MSYPELPHNRLVVGGVDLNLRFGLVMTDDYSLSPPAYKSYQVDIPGSDSSIDLTSAVTGFPTYANRSQSFSMLILYPDNFERTKTELSNYLHGKDFDYELTMDPGYVYHGRFSVDEYSNSFDIGVIKIQVEAKPYKMKPTKSYRLNAAGGRMFTFKSGRKPIRPIMTADNAVQIMFDGKEFMVPQGTWRLNDVLFVEGDNELYINSFPMRDTRWADLSAGGKNEMSWDEAKKYRWDEIARINLNDGDIPQAWNDLAGVTWDSLSTKKWSDLDWRPSDTVNETVKLEYEWGDL